VNWRLRTQRGILAVSQFFVYLCKASLYAQFNKTGLLHGVGSHAELVENRPDLGVPISVPIRS
jgi:hypothetical protein